MSEQIYTINGYVLDESTQTGIPELQVEAWDRDGRVDGAVGLTVTRDQGDFRITFTQSYLTELFGDQWPITFYFKVLAGDSVLADTRDTETYWNTNEPDRQVTIMTSAQTYSVTGTVINEESGERFPNAQVELWDVDGRYDGAVTTATTNDEGTFQINLVDEYLRQIYGDEIPAFYFRVIAEDGSVLTSTRDTLNWTIDESGNDVTISIQSSETYTVSGTVIDEESGQTMGNVRVELRDVDGRYSGAVVNVTTDADGRFQINVTHAYLQQVFADDIPPFYFQVFAEDGTLLVSTQDTLHWTIDESGTDVEITIPRQESDNSYNVTVVTIGSQSGNPMPSLTVEAWDSSHGYGSAIASATTSASGIATFTFTDAQLRAIFGSSANVQPLYFNVLQAGTLLASTEGSQTWHPTNGNATYEVVIPEEEEPGGDPGQPTGSGQRGCGDVNVTTYSITGSVTSPNRAGLGGLQVKLFDKGVGGDVQIGQGTIDDCGNFKITFSASQITERGKTRPDVQAKAYWNGTEVGASEVRYNAFGNEHIEINLPPDAGGLRSEHEALTAGLATHYSGSLRNLQENDTRQDVTYLANKSGWDARAVAMAATADDFSNRTSGAVASSYFYALFRAGLPANENVLYHTDETTLSAVWNAAVDQGVLPSSARAGIPTALTRFREQSAQKLLSAPALVGSSSMTDMLATSGLNDTQKQQFADIYSRNRNNPTQFWSSVSSTLGASTAQRLQVDGKLAFLTINNAPLMAAVRQAAGGTQFTDTVKLAQNGFYRAEAWSELLTGNVPIPEEIPGESTEEKRANYAEYLAAKVRISYPTASIADMVGRGEIAIQQTTAVKQFLTQYEGSFDLGTQPVEQYIAQNQLSVAQSTVTELKRLQRVYQITSSDDTMVGLLDSGIDSATAVAEYDRSTFVETFGDQLGGAEAAEQVHERSVQIHNAVLNIAIGYLTASNGIPIGRPPLDPNDPEGTATGGILETTPAGPGSVTLGQPLGAAGAGGPLSTPATDIMAYATLESLFGSMDYCACDHCRSILSPAAYLVDLLYFLKKKSPPASVNPLNILLARRPDIQHLPLTCENTNTALPYIDVVNETLEYYITNSLSLAGYLGHDTGTMKSEDLLASPAFVIDTAYTTLANQRFPIPLPFHRPLESLRRHFNKFEVYLPKAMELLRQHNNLERGSAVYGWRDILMEELQMSRGEYEIFTDTTAVPLWRLYGFPTSTADATVIAGLSNAKSFSRRLGISYDDLVALLRTRFVNPNSDLIPKLEKLNVSFSIMKQLMLGTISVATFNSYLPTGAGAPNPADYGGNIATWVTTPANYNRIMALITLADINGTDPCSFDTLELRFANPMANASDTSTRITAVDYIRIIRFVRLWKKTGWTMEQTDAAISALYRVDMAPTTAADFDTIGELNTGFLTLLPRIGLIISLMRELDLNPKRDLASVLALWSNIGTLGDNSLYQQMFLNPTILSQNPVYAADSNGAFLTNPAVMLSTHAESLRAAFGLTGDEYDRIIASLSYTGSTVLNVANISQIFRRGYLARILRISVRELLTLMSLTGIDPFSPPDLTNSGVLQLAKLVRDLRDLSLKPASALYYIWNQDLSGLSSPTATQINEFIRSLRDDFLKIESEFVVADDPTGEIARTRMTLVYGTDATDFFFSLLNDTFVSQAAYSHAIPNFGTALASALQTAGGTYGSPVAPRLVYDDFRKVLTYNGVLDATTKNTIKNVATTGAFSADIPAGQLATYQTAFQNAVEALYTANSSLVGPFFVRYSDLDAPFQTYRASTDPPATKRNTLLANFIPTLITRYKVQRVLLRLADATQTDRAFAEALVNASPASSGIHAASGSSTPAINDLVGLESLGLSAQFYNAATIGPNPQPARIDSNLVYGPGTNPLPPNGVSTGAPISVAFSGSIEAPASGPYTIAIDAEASSGVTLTIDGVLVPLARSGNTWRNSTVIQFTVGVFYAVDITVTSVTTTLRIQLETTGRGGTPIAPRLLYPGTKLTPARNAYLRFLKAAALASALKLSAAEVALPKIAGVSWLNSLPIVGNAPTPALLYPPFREVIDYAVVKGEISPDSNALLTVVKDPAAATANSDSFLFKLTGWDQASLNALMTRFSTTTASLNQPTLLRRVYDTFGLLRAMGISGSALIAATTNEPTATTVRDLQSALRARYANEDWRTLVQPINDEMRGLQRDALVAYILHQLRSNPTTAHINTADKLFEYFLMDVQMEPCMQTSRIRHALSSVQLFIERCLMNLEANVPGSLLNGDQWEWMKRYRVWEANRKVFLFPENWLEPELRDDKSPFFKEIESELLESDITEESAAVAMLNYMAKLEEVAKLEPVGFYHIPADPAARTGEINHVVARTPGAYRKYYYRRREYGYWTPWEEVKLDIEDNPVQPAVWQDRLFLFWLKILKKGPDSTAGQKPNYSGSGDNLAEITVPDAPKTQVQAVLCWSEYYNGKWQMPKSSDMEHPVNLSAFDSGGSYAFDRSEVLLNVIPEGSALRINVGYHASFLMYNTHSTPEQVSVSHWPFYLKNRWQGNYTNDLTFSYGLCTNYLCYAPVPRQVLRPLLAYSVVLPSHPMADEWNIPLFYQDKRHVFYVSMREEQVYIRDYQLYGIPTTSGSTARASIPGTVTFSAGNAGTATATWSGGSLSAGVLAPGSNPAGLFVSQDANIRQAFTSTQTVSYGGRSIGPGGTISNQG